MTTEVFFEIFHKNEALFINLVFFSVIYSVISHLIYLLFLVLTFTQNRKLGVAMRFEFGWTGCRLIPLPGSDNKRVAVDDIENNRGDAPYPPQVSSYEKESFGQVGKNEEVRK